ncbi:MAG: hypothetical protein AAF743_14190, partial [Planctomycetota bacterium]
TVKVPCPACERSFKIPSSKLGKSAKCPCGEKFVLELPAPPEDDDDLYGFADDDDDIPALAAPPRPAVTPAATSSAPPPVAATPAQKIGGYDATGAMGIGLTGKRHVEHDEPPTLGKGALLALVLTAVTAGVWYIVKERVPPGSALPVGAFAVVLGGLAGLGMAVGAVRGNTNTGFVATLIALAGMAAAKALIITTIVIPNADERQAAIVEDEFGPQVKVEDVKMTWQREDIVEQMAFETMPDDKPESQEELFYLEGPDFQAGRLRTARAKAKELTDEEVAAFERRRDVRIARNLLTEQTYAGYQEEDPKYGRRGVEMYEKQAAEFVDAMSDDEVLEATEADRTAQRDEELVMLHARAKLVDEGGNPDAYDDKTYIRMEALTEEARVEVAGMTSEQRDTLYDDYRSAEYDVEIEAEVASQQRNNQVENIAAEAESISDMVSCADPLFWLVGLAAAFGFGVTGKFWGER